MDRHLREDRLTETAERLSCRVAERFPSSGLSRVAAEVLDVLRGSFARAERIRRPNWFLRAGYVLLVVLAIGAFLVAWRIRSEGVSLGQHVLNLLDETKGMAVYLSGFALFLFTLETRLKRRRALQAIHELRALAHIIDMHQLTKVPDRVGQPSPYFTRVMTADDVGQYLRFCTELLALVSKVGQLYVQDFLDGVTLAAVDQFENLATGLSSKIWQKIMILDRTWPAGSGAGPANGPAAVRETPPVEPVRP
jgi:hypothetical protein